MIKLKGAYDSMPRSDERRALVERPHDTEHNNAVALRKYSRLRMRRRGMPKRAVAANQSGDGVDDA
jgi:hypothetical protein